MDSVAQQRTVVDDKYLCNLMGKLLSGQSLRDMVGSVASETFGFLSRRQSTEPQSLSSLVALVPQSSEWKLSSAELLEEFLSIITEDEGSTDPPKEILASENLLSAPLTLIPTVLSETKETMSSGSFQVPVQRLSSSNGVSINLADSSSLNDQQTAFRVTLPLSLGRIQRSSATSDAALLSMAVKTIAEGGAMGRYSRSQVEQWCIDNNLAVEVSTSLGGDGKQQIVLNFAAVTPQEASVTLSALFQVSPSHEFFPHFSSDGSSPSP